MSRKAAKPETPSIPPSDAPLRLVWADPTTIQPNYKNWRIHPAHQMEALRRSQERAGWAGALTYNETTGRLINGHARLAQALRDQTKAVPVLVGAWTEQAEASLLLTMDPIAALSDQDNEAIRALIETIEIPGEPALERLADQVDLQFREPPPPEPLRITIGQFRAMLEPDEWAAWLDKLEAENGARDWETLGPILLERLGIPAEAVLKC